MTSEERREAYNCDITYVTNNELGFDYLRDNMVIYKEQLVLRDLHYAIIDEVDSVLIDEARTPLIISGQSGKSTKLYEVCDYLARVLKRGEASGEFSKMNAIMGEEIIETGILLHRALVVGHVDIVFLHKGAKFLRAAAAAGIFHPPHEAGEKSAFDKQVQAQPPQRCAIYPAQGALAQHFFLLQLPGVAVV